MLQRRACRHLWYLRSLLETQLKHDPVRACKKVARQPIHAVVRSSTTLALCTTERSTFELQESISSTRPILYYASCSLVPSNPLQNALSNVKWIMGYRIIVTIGMIPLLSSILYLLLAGAAHLFFSISSRRPLCLHFITLSLHFSLLSFSFDLLVRTQIHSPFSHISPWKSRLRNAPRFQSRQRNQEIFNAAASPCRSPQSRWLGQATSF